MKKIIYLFLLCQLISVKTFAGSISGNISYSGIATDTIFIAAFTSSTLDGEPISIKSISLPGNYSLNGLDDGTYYIVSVMTNNTKRIKPTDPYGFWGTLDGLTPVIVSANNGITGINITLIDGTTENPNPFAEYYTDPNELIQLSNLSMDGINPCIAYDGTSIYLYKHDYLGAASAKIYIINPENGEIFNTIYLSLQSLSNGISWINKMVFCNGELWATGGYGDPSGTGNYIPGFFKVNLSSSTSSSQIPFNTAIKDDYGLACDGTNFFLGVEDTLNNKGIIKFNTNDVAELLPNYFISLNEQRFRYLSYGDDFLWVGVDKLNKFNPVSGEYIESLDLQGNVAQLYFDGKFWTYDESDNTLKIYYLSTVDIDNNSLVEIPSNFSLSQNYPNPFNPTTEITFAMPTQSLADLRIYDILGREVAVLINHQNLSAGTYSYKFNANGLSSGTYIYQISTDKNVISKKMSLLK